MPSPTIPKNMFWAVERYGDGQYDITVLLISKTRRVTWAAIHSSGGDFWTVNRYDAIADSLEDVANEYFTLPAAMAAALEWALQQETRYA